MIKKKKLKISKKIQLQFGWGTAECTWMNYGTWIDCGTNEVKANVQTLGKRKN